MIFRIVAYDDVLSAPQPAQDFPAVAVEKAFGFERLRDVNLVRAGYCRKSCVTMCRGTRYLTLSKTSGDSPGCGSAAAAAAGRIRTTFGKP